MNISKQQIKRFDKIQQALSTVYAKVVKFKKQKGTDIVIMQDGKIGHIKPPINPSVYLCVSVSLWLKKAQSLPRTMNRASQQAFHL